MLWLLDAGLQFQPYMYTSAFPSQVIASTAAGNPRWVAGPVTWSAGLLAGHLPLYNTLFALVQLAIAVGLLWPRTVRVALAGSVVWALAVWWLGEGLGGILTGAVSPLHGAPGAALLYAVVAVLVWPTRHRVGRSVATRSALRVWGAQLTWLALWLGLAIETLLPGDRSPSAMHDLVTGGEAGQPEWVKAIDRAAATVLDHHGTQASVVLAVVCAAVGVGVLLPRLLPAALVLAVVVAVIIWVVGEDFGGVATGSATDPNTGPLLLLLTAAFWPTAAATVPAARPRSR